VREAVAREQGLLARGRCGSGGLEGVRERGAGAVYKWLLIVVEIYTGIVLPHHTKGPINRKKRSFYLLPPAS
jgi:hypothetical protein